MENYFKINPMLLSRELKSVSAFNCWEVYYNGSIKLGARQKKRELTSYGCIIVLNKCRANKNMVTL